MSGGRRFHPAKLDTFTMKDDVVTESLDEISKSIKETLSRIDTDEKSTTNTNEAKLDEIKLEKRTKLQQIMAILRHKGMDNQQYDSAIAEIEKVL